MAMTGPIADESFGGGYRFVVIMESSDISRFGAAIGQR